MKYTIGITTFNDVNNVTKCIHSIVPFLTDDYECLIIDDGSESSIQNQIKQIAQLHPSIRVMLSSHNKGLVRQCNTLLEASQGEYILILNNDIVWQKNVVDHMLSFFNGKVGIGGMCGIQLTSQFDSIHIHNNQIQSPIYVDAVAGYCMMIHRSVIQTGIRFDNSIRFMIHEDVDFCLQAKLKSISSVMIPQIPLQHIGHQSLHLYKTSFDALFYSNWMYMIQKWSNKLAFNNLQSVQNKLSEELKQRITLQKSREVETSSFYDVILPNQQENSSA